ncbi:MAG: glutamine-hydrolyzing GMP synthase [Alphaproteobacteria bacterium]|nr:glutamine-hydrolyzing GMP synthase [Alphaproteobacteria bacterium]
MTHETLLILDFGSQYTQLIARRLREHGVFCVVRPCTDAAALPEGTVGLVLSGGPASVLGDDAPPFDTRWLDVDVPILGVCYGMQLLALHHGGRVERGQYREYGRSALVRTGPCVLLDHFADVQNVWMSHGDHVAAAPPGFTAVGKSADGVVAAMQSDDGRVFGLQFHPEVTHTDGGSELVRRFAMDVCGAKGDWKPSAFIAEQIEALRVRIGDERVICGLSGGVDSSVVAALLHEAIGNQLHCIFVDNGLLREGEREAVEAEFSEYQLTVVDASARFLTALEGVTEPERKRKAIGEVFVRVFEEAARGIEGARFLAQGTLYPDVIESVSVRGPSATIKSHHNVGGLPDDLAFELVEPVRELFKDEVRQVGLALGLSKSRVYRQPFPGPGLGIRCLGEITSPRLATLRAADRIVRHEIEAAGLQRAVWQSFCVLLPVKTVGVMGDERTYEEVCAIRAVHSTDGMTADWVELPYALLARMSNRIINEVKGINRVVYDISSKPPGTIEWE